MELHVLNIRKSGAYWPLEAQWSSLHIHQLLSRHKILYFSTLHVYDFQKNTDYFSQQHSTNAFVMVTESIFCEVWTWIL